jgi:hypothetical protein
MIYFKFAKGFLLFLFTVILLDCLIVVPDIKQYQTTSFCQTVIFQISQTILCEINANKKRTVWYFLVLVTTKI